MKHVLLTGAAGFIGSRTCEALLKSGVAVTGIDNLDSYYPHIYKQKNIERLQQYDRFTMVRGDIRNHDLLYHLMNSRKIDLVVHLAARAGVRPSIADPLLYSDVNVNGTTNILNVMQQLGLKNLVFASSSSVYGDRNEVPFSETDRVEHPISPYAATKRAGELMCYNFHHLYDFNISCLRFFTVYGPGQRPEMAIHKFVRRAYKRLPLAMYGDGSSARDYTYIDDIVDGVIKSINHLEGFNIYNLGNSHPVQLSELLELIGQSLPLEPEIRQEDFKAGDVSITYADVSKAQKELGYKPGTPLQEGIQKFVEWFEANRSWLIDSFRDE